MPGCLHSLAFCDQILVADLGSEDNSAQIAQECGAEVLAFNKVAIVEHILPAILPFARNEWVVRLDPDEIFPLSLVYDLCTEILRSDLLAIISVPYQYYFRGKPLTSTIWGGTRYIPRVFHKERVILEPYVHSGIRCKEGYMSAKIEKSGCNFVQHYWADSFAQLFEKHQRYIQEEGEARYQQGQRFTWRKLPGAVLYALKYNLIDCGGVQDGLIGIVLSMFYAWYVTMSLLSLRRYQKRHCRSQD
ncbi:MAG: hypothetical protein H5T68_04950 [Chloroflexi bacterium]|nr:hypothetical protein [Chloroflexota bacterium]